MKFYRVATPAGVQLHSGTVRLLERQAADRMHLISKKNKNHYSIDKPIFFKMGEVFGYVGHELSRSQVDALTPVEAGEIAAAEADEQKEKKAKAEAEAKKKAEKEEKARKKAEAEAKKKADEEAAKAEAEAKKKAKETE